MNNRNLRIGLLISLITLAVICLLVAIFFTYSSLDNGHWERYTVDEYEFRDSEVEIEMSKWIDSLLNQCRLSGFETDAIDFDLCYQPWVDTIWDAQQKNVVDSFNLRLHSHSYYNNYLRREGFDRLIKGCCKINSHVIYLYDEKTISMFCQTKKKPLKLRKFIPKEHGFLDWQDELVAVAYVGQQLRKVDTQNKYFYLNEFLFYDSIDFADKEYFIETVDVDTFVQRLTGPYLVLQEGDELSQDTTIENMRKLIVRSFSQEDLLLLDRSTRISIVCYVDSLGKVVYRNHSTSDFYEKVDSTCKQLPTFVPAHIRGKRANSVICFYFVMFHLMNE